MSSSADMSVWTGRVDAEEGPHALRWHQVVQAVEAARKPGVALLGFACDEGVRRNQGRVGARNGPRALRQSLAGLALHSPRPLYDGGDVTCDDGDLERAQREFSDRLTALLSQGHFPVGLGGGHEIADATFMGLARHLGVGRTFLSASDGDIPVASPKEAGAGSALRNTGQECPVNRQAGKPALHAAPRIGIVNLDAHFDLRQAAQPNSGTSFLEIARFCRADGLPFHYCCLGIAEPANTAALFDRAREMGVTWRTDEAMGVAQLPETLECLREFAARVDHLYLTVCLDVLPASIAPGVSAPAALGVPLEVILALVNATRATGKLAVADVAELNPQFDQDGRTARAAARIVHQLAR